MTPPGGAQRTIAQQHPAFHRTFGSVAEPLPLLDYTYDNGRTSFNQNADGFFMGCRGYALASIAGHEDNALYDPKKTYEHISLYEGHSKDEGGQIISALNFGVVEGLVDSRNLLRRRGKPFLVDKVPGYDWFDSHRLALRKAKVSISVGTIWFEEWMFTPAQFGVVTSQFVFDGTWDSELGHNYEMMGEKTIQGEPTLEVDAWLGRKFYFPREAFNKAFDIYGTGSWIQLAYTPQDILYTKLTILQRVVSLLARYISTNLAKKFPQYYL